MIALWDMLDKKKKERYKKLISKFAGLTKAFAQKNENNNSLPIPFLNSKFQEKLFINIFDANLEDTNNTPFDVSLLINGKVYLIGIKTFDRSAKSQKIQQFKRLDQKCDESNLKAFVEMVAASRNKSIEDNTKEIIEKLRNPDEFSKHVTNKPHRSIYHLLTRYLDENNIPKIQIREFPYDKIDDKKISNVKPNYNKDNHLASISFEDGKHKYRYTMGDNQLLMCFDENPNDPVENLSVSYLEENEIYDFLTKIGGEINDVDESHSWKINIERYSGLNSFFGTAPKNRAQSEQKCIDMLVAQKNNCKIIDLVKEYFAPPPANLNEKEKDVLRAKKVNIRFSIEKEMKSEKYNKDVVDRIKEKIYRPQNEMYISIPNYKIFHKKFPNFFGEGLAKKRNKSDRVFDMILEPYGWELKMLLTQSSGKDDVLGKAIQSYKSQAVLGKWVLESVFKLPPYRPLTEEAMKIKKINGIRLYKKRNNSKVYFKFIWIDDENRPEDYWE